MDLSLTLRPPSPPLLPTAAAMKKTIEGVTEELNSIASQNLDYAAARRRVRSAFIPVHQQLDHFLFKKFELYSSVFTILYNVIAYDDRTRLRTAVELLNATKKIEKQVEKVSSPLLILHGAADKVTDPAVSRFLYEQASSKDKTLKLYEEGYHCILEGEPDDRILTVLNDIISWLDARC
ncbi:hypothetical protein like AT1G77420 [Hibiscus trionum]|uniref:Serine aminopeptidase S33 domain-containing protein n=1 Tax=Hibiscus trionum TaxID=183268 RepID=A0A9W7HFL3_HIBTR|nr:hypothetical protein like AT1G77420 [Hibiscus trionum]